MKNSYLIKGVLVTMSLCATLFSGQAKAQWVEESSGFATPGTSVFNISATSITDVWASGTLPTGATGNVPYTHSSDGGTTWTAATIAGTSGMQISNLYAASSTTAWAAVFSPTAGGGQIYNTANGGTTWTLKSNNTMYSSSTSFLDFVYFFDTNHGVAVGDPVNGSFEIYITANGGAVWTAVNANNIPAAGHGEAGTINDYAIAGNKILFGTTLGNVFYSPDSGKTWHSSSTGLTSTSQVVFKDALNGLANSNSGNGANLLSSTTDGGQTWTVVPNLQGLPVGGDIAFITGTSYTYACMYPGGSSYSSASGGAPWISMATNANFSNGIAFASPSNGWAGGINAANTKGGIFKWTGLPNVSVGIFYGAVCPNVAFTLPYVVNTSFNTGNIFTAQLSDMNGSFANPVLIGAKASTVSDTMTVKIPANIAKGVGYRIRIQASNIAYTSPDNGYDIYLGTVITTQPSNQIVCAPTTTASYSVAAIAHNDTVTYQWQIANGKNFTNISTNNSTYSGTNTNMLLIATATPSLAGSQYRCVLIGGCGDTTISNVANLYTGSNTLATITTQPVDQTICIGGTANFDVALTHDTTGYLYQWQLSSDGVNYSNYGGTEPYFTFANVQYGYNNLFFRCVITSCGGGTVTSSAAKLIVLPYLSAPMPVITVNGSVLMSSATSGNQWYKDGVLIAGATNQSYTATSNGVYKVVVQDANSCNVQSNSVNITAAGIATQTFFGAHLSMKPNPSNGLVTVGGLSSKSIVNVVSITGQVLHQETTTNTELQMNLEQLPKGMYLIQVIDGQQSATEKLIIE